MCVSVRVQDAWVGMWVGSRGDWLVACGWFGSGFSCVCLEFLMHVLMLGCVCVWGMM